MRQAAAGLYSGTSNASTPSIRIVGEPTTLAPAPVYGCQSPCEDGLPRQADPLERQVQHRQRARLVRTVLHNKECHIHKTHRAPTEAVSEARVADATSIHSGVAPLSGRTHPARPGTNPGDVERRLGELGVDRLAVDLVVGMENRPGHAN